MSDNLDDARQRLRDQATAAGEYLTVLEVAELARCEHKAVRRAIGRGQLQAFQPAQRLLIREDDARAWIESRPAGSPGTSAPRRSSRARSVPGSVARLREIERGVPRD